MLGLEGLASRAAHVTSTPRRSRTSSIRSGRPRSRYRPTLGPPCARRHDGRPTLGRTNLRAAHARAMRGTTPGAADRARRSRRCARSDHRDLARLTHLVPVVSRRVRRAEGSGAPGLSRSGRGPGLWSTCGLAQEIRRGPRARWVDATDRDPGAPREPHGLRARARLGRAGRSDPGDRERGGAHMARRGDGLYQRGKTWWLDFTHEGARYVARLGKGITARWPASWRASSAPRSSRARPASAGRSGGPRVRESDRGFMAWADANKRPAHAADLPPARGAAPRRSPASAWARSAPFDFERHKQARAEAAPASSSIASWQCSAALYNRCREWGKYEGDNPGVKVARQGVAQGACASSTPTRRPRSWPRPASPCARIILVGIHAGLRCSRRR